MTMDKNAQTQHSPEQRGEKNDRTKQPAQSEAKEQKALEGNVVQLKGPEHAKLLEEAAQGKEYKDKYIRLYAEFDNARKRMEREKLEFLKYANGDLIGEFLGILDNLERSVEAAQTKHEDYTAFLKGVEMIMAQIHELFKKNGVKPIEAKGKMFDPHCHEILMQEENGKVEEGIVLDEFQRGYYLEDCVIRTAKVKVATRKEKK